MKQPSLDMDAYKQFHRQAYHPDVTEVYSNFISRSGKWSNVPGGNAVTFVGLQYFIKQYLIKEWDEFFAAPKEQVLANHKRIASAMLGKEVDVKYLEDLHDLGYLPLRIKALEEGTFVPYGVAPITVVNTVEGFQWLTNMIETAMSADNWGMQTSATTSTEYLRVFYEFAEKTGLPLDFVPFQGHDFSFRGMFGREAAAMSGFAHLATGFVGTDTIPAICFAEEYYNANVDTELVGCSVEATEHSVTCSWQKEGEETFINYLMDEVSKDGILSVVADTWDFWNLVTNILPKLKDKIMSRNGALIIRPDSGDPVDILCGTACDATNLDEYEDWKTAAMEICYDECQLAQFEDATTPIATCVKEFIRDGVVHKVTYEPMTNRYDKTYYYLEGWDESDFVFEELPVTPEQKGLIECLWDIFGGTITDKGYKLLDEHIGAIYGDSITLARQREILTKLADKGFASKVVLGIGSFTFQYITRDTHGSAVKATRVVKAGERQAIFKAPKTDLSKRSAKGLLKVDYDENGSIVQYDDVTEAEEAEGLLRVVFENGKLVREVSLAQIRAKVKSQW